jgi:hypothetical protein
MFQAQLVLFCPNPEISLFFKKSLIPISRVFINQDQGTKCVLCYCVFIASRTCQTKIENTCVYTHLLFSLPNTVYIRNRPSLVIPLLSFQAHRDNTSLLSFFVFITAPLSDNGKLTPIIHNIFAYVFSSRIHVSIRIASPYHCENKSAC